MIGENGHDDGWGEFELRYPRAVEEFKRRMWLDGLTTSLSAWHMNYLKWKGHCRPWSCPIHNLKYGGQNTFDAKQILDRKQNWTQFLYLLSRELKEFEEWA